MRGFLLLLIASFFLLSNISAQAVTYKTVQPIFLNKCVACHRQGDAAPFSLTTYEDVFKRLSFIKNVITENYMPPWKPDVHYRDFANNRSLTENEKKTILLWIKNKAPKGDYKEQEEGKATLLKETAYNRKPDVTLKIDSAFTVPGNNTERFIIFKIPYEFDKAKNVEAIEFYSNNKKVMHHINYGFYDVADTSVDIYGGIKTLDSENDTTRLDPYGKFKKVMTYYTGWIPGTSFESYPKDYGWILPKRGVLLLTAHYSATAVEEKSIVGVNLFFKKDSIKREVKIISFGSAGVAEKDITPQLLIMPNKISTFTLDVQTSQDQSVMYVWPHMHYLGKDFLAYAITPKEDTIKLVHIPQWDFKWQELYRMKKMVKIPGGSILHMECTYDNTLNNPNNPNNPPKAVYSFGDMRSTDEMMTLLMIYLPYKKGDEDTSLENPH